MTGTFGVGARIKVHEPAHADLGGSAVPAALTPSAFMVGFQQRAPRFCEPKDGHAPQMATLVELVERLMKFGWGSWTEHPRWPEVSSVSASGLTPIPRNVDNGLQIIGIVALQPGAKVSSCVVPAAVVREPGDQSGSF